MLRVARLSAGPGREAAGGDRQSQCGREQGRHCIGGSVFCAQAVRASLPLIKHEESAICTTLHPKCLLLPLLSLLRRAAV